MPPKVAKPRKKANGYRMPEKFNEGFSIKDLFKNNWTLGKPIGQGGFGLIYMAYKGESMGKNEDAQFVVKIEPKDNGPLFCETHFYANTAKEEDIKSFMQSRGLKHLGIPRYISTGLCTYNESEYRFLVMDRYARDLQSYLNDSATHQINEAGVLCLMRQIINTLEYIHSRGYAHGDIKGANVMLKSDSQAYLVDYGLVVRFERDGQQQKYHIKPERRHNGTIEYTSRDAHDGAGINRRSDMEILGYCAMHWLSGTLPWIDLIANCEKVQQSKVKSMSNVKEFISTTFKNVTNVSDTTKHFLEYYLNEVNKLAYESEPAYGKIQSKITEVLKALGHSSQVDNFGIFSAPKTQKKAASSAASRIVDSGDETPVKPTSAKEANGTTAKKRTAKKPLDEEKGAAAIIPKEAAKTKATENKKTVEYENTDDEDDILILKPNESKKPRKKTTKATSDAQTELESEAKVPTSNGSATPGAKETAHPRRAATSRVLNYFEDDESDDQERKKTQQNAGVVVKSHQQTSSEHSHRATNAAQNDIILKMRQTNFSPKPQPPSSPLALGALACKSQQETSCILVKKRRNVATATVATQTDRSIFSSN